MERTCSTGETQQNIVKYRDIGWLQLTTRTGRFSELKLELSSYISRISSITTVWSYTECLHLDQKGVAWQQRGLICVLCTDYWASLPIICPAGKSWLSLHTFLENPKKDKFSNLSSSLFPYPWLILVNKKADIIWLRQWLDQGEIWDW